MRMIGNFLRDEKNIAVLESKNDCVVIPFVDQKHLTAIITRNTLEDYATLHTTSFQSVPEAMLEVIRLVGNYQEFSTTVENVLIIRTGGPDIPSVDIPVRYRSEAMLRERLASMILIALEERE